MNSIYRHWLCFRSVLPVLKLCRFSLICVLVGAAALIFVDQAQEALRALAEESGRRLWTYWGLFLFLVYLWAFASAYFARVILYIDFADTTGHGPCTEAAREKIPRYLGMAAVVSVALAILISAYDASSGSTTQWLYGVSAFLFYSTHPFYILLRKRLEYVDRFNAFVLRRWAGLRGTSYTPAADSTPLNRGFAPLARRFLDLPKETIHAFVAFFALTFVSFVAFTYWPLQSGQLGAPSILILALIAWIPFGTMLVYLTERYHTPPLLTVMLIAALLFSFFFDHHGVRTLAEPATPKRLTVTEQAEKWLKSRADAIKAAKGNYPVYFVAAEGGGIRAAYWSASVLAMLQDQLGGTAQQYGRFSDHVFAVSGVSGGSLGGAVFTALVAEKERDKIDSCTRYHREHGSGSPLQDCVHNALDADFLGPTIATMLYPDLVYHFLPAISLIAPQQYADRAVTVESGWEASWSTAFSKSKAMSDTFDRLWAGRPFDVPSLLLNGTNVETGKRMIMSNLEINPEDPNGQSLFSDAYDVQQLLQKQVRLSTAVHMSARFTYVSPAGTINSTRYVRPDTNDDKTLSKKPKAPKEIAGHIVDGGYFENSGAATAQEVIRAFNKVVTGSQFKGKVYPVLILLSNNPERQFDNCRVLDNKFKTVRVATEVLAPLDALLNAREARGTFAEEAVVPQLDEPAHCVRFALRDEGHPLPLGWTLSSDTEKNIDNQWQRMFIEADAKSPLSQLCAGLGRALGPLVKKNEFDYLPRCGARS